MLYKKLVVLIVDDSLLIIDKIIQLLQDCEVIRKIIVSSDYDSAIKLIDSEKPDVALLDINLPYKSGIDILSYIRQGGHPVKVIMFTNEPTDQHKNLCLKIGADHFLDKSRDIETLLSIFSSLPKVQAGL